MADIQDDGVLARWHGWMSLVCLTSLTNRLASPTPQAGEHASLTHREGPLEDIARGTAGRQDDDEMEQARRFRNLGMQLLSISLGPRTSAIATTADLTSFERTTYLRGLEYILQGLPEDLSQEEEEVLARAWPGYNQLRIQSQNEELQLYRDTQISNIISTVIVLIFVLYSHLEPYIRHLFRVAVEYERSHGLIQSGSSYVARRSSRILRDIRNERVMIRIVRMAVWILGRFVQGVNQGIREGAEVYTARRRVAPRGVDGAASNSG